MGGTGLRGRGWKGGEEDGRIALLPAAARIPSALSRGMTTVQAAGGRIPVEQSHGEPAFAQKVIGQPEGPTGF